MTESRFHPKPQWFKGSRDRGYRGELHSKKHIPEFLRLKKTQQLWDFEGTHEAISA